MRTIYKFRKTEDGDIMECDCCNYEAPLAEFEDDRFSKKRGPYFFCRVCSESMISRYWNGPPDEDFALYRVIAQVANIVISELKARHK